VPRADYSWRQLKRASVLHAAAAQALIQYQGLTMMCFTPLLRRIWFSTKDCGVWLWCVHAGTAQALIQYVQMNKAKDNDWFQLAPANAEGTTWKGKCWYVYNLLRYEFDLRFDIPVTYPPPRPSSSSRSSTGRPPRYTRGRQCNRHVSSLSELCRSLSRMSLPCLTAQHREVTTSLFFLVLQMYRGGKICLSHSLQAPMGKEQVSPCSWVALRLSPWLAHCLSLHSSFSQSFSSEALAPKSS